MRRLALALALLALAAVRCQLPPETAGACAVCVTADACCAAHTANPDSNCQLFATCEAAHATDQVTIASGCAYYLRVASTPPAPAACGPHPEE